MLHLSNPDITADSVVHVSVCQVVDLVFGPRRSMRLIGGADIHVGSFSPRDGAVDFVVHISPGWNAHLMADISIFDPPPGGVVIGT